MEIVKKSGKGANSPTCRPQFSGHPKTNPGSLNFMNFNEKLNEPNRNGQKRAAGAKVRKSDETHGLTQGFEEVEMEKINFGSRGSNLELQNVTKSDWEVSGEMELQSVTNSDWEVSEEMDLRNPGWPCLGSTGESTNTKLAEPKGPNEKKHHENACTDGDECTNPKCIYGHSRSYKDVYWSAYAIQYWLKEWFRQRPVSGWTIGNYDGEESYHELGTKLTDRHAEEPRIQLQQFHHMRSVLIGIEGEMVETSGIA